MRAIILTTALSISGSTHCPAQEVIGNDGDLARLTATIEAMNKAATDATKDSLSEVLKSGLRALLDADNGLSRDLEALPITRVDAPDGKFRLITWNVAHTDGTHRYEGLLLVNDRKRRTLFDLRDMTENIPSPETPELGPERWYGALYYAVVPVKKGAKTYYTLLGWKGLSKIETRKVIEVLGFKGGQPRFGAPLFGEGRLKKNRVVFGYSQEVSMSLRWEAADGRIICDHLVPLRPDLEGQWPFYGPDLSYDAYGWQKGRWVFQRDVDVRGDGQSKPYNPPPKNTP